MLPEPWNTLVGTPLSIVITLVLAVVARWVSHRFIDRVVRNAHDRHEARLKAVRTVGGRTFAEATGYASTRHQQRMATTASVLKSTLTGIIGGSALLMILDLLGLPLAPLLASAGVGGLAIGFGAQSLVKDFFSGVFMIAEDQYGVGDVIDTGTVSGTVEEVTLRITRLRDADGVVWYLRNGEILRVGNRSPGLVGGGRRRAGGLPRGPAPGHRRHRRGRRPARRRRAVVGRPHREPQPSPGSSRWPAAS